MRRPALLAAAGVVVAAVGFVKPIEPLVEIGLGLIVAALITNPKPKA